jgi:V-type H+-transporting ATPase subunit H
MDEELYSAFNTACCSIIEQLGGKQLVMQLLGHEDPNVRYEALLAVQKLMVHNW